MRTESVKRMSQLAWALGIAAAALGCQSPKAEKGYVEEYREGQYAAAYQEAQEAYAATEGPAKERAACVAGIASYSMGRRDLAEQWLTPLVRANDQEVAGTAGWTLGLIAADRNQHARALSLYDEAIPKLKGDDAASAQLAAAESLTRLNRPAEARQRAQAAATIAQSDFMRGKAQQRLTGGNTAPAAPFPPIVTQVGPAGTRSPGGTAGPYSIQLGAFADRGRAERMAKAATPAAAGAKQPAPRLVATTDRKSGSTLQAVRIGPYANRAAAEAALRQMGLSGTVLAGN